MILHVLAGDSLLEPFKKLGLEGEIAVFRECLADGPVEADSLEAFYALRERFLTESFPEVPGAYRENVRTEIEKALTAGEGDELNLWFEHELFCQVNLWFLLSKVRDSEAKIFFVGPVNESHEDRFAGWAALDGEGLAKSFENRIELIADDLELGDRLWKAFASRDSVALRDLGTSESKVFMYLEEVTNAAAEIDSRPRDAVKEIVSEGADSFGDCFRKFSSRLPVYGFGDLQVKSIYERVVGGEQ